MIPCPVKNQNITSGLTLTAHQVRHGYASILFEAGVPPKAAQVYLGHAQLSTTMDIYTHVRDKYKKELDKKIQSALAEL